MFDSVVRNAFDFLNRSIEEVEAQPKYSVIHFWSAIELLFKARLLVEHWTLVVADPGSVNRHDFESGNFRSISYGDAVQRIANVLNEQVPTRHQRVFDQLRDHRNKLIHFSHPQYSATPVSPATIQEVVAEQSLGWYLLADLLRGKWRDCFSRFNDEVVAFEKRLKDKGHFLRGKYATLKDSIEKQKSRGTVVHGCPVCTFESAIERSNNEGLVDLKCLVCDDVRIVLKLDCPRCSELILYEDLSGTCAKCMHRVDVDSLIEKLTPEIHSGDDFLMNELAICHWCEYIPASVVPWGEEFLCVACLEQHEHTTSCEFCGGAMTGSSEDTYLTGCAICEGKLGWERD